LSPTAVRKIEIPTKVGRPIELGGWANKRWLASDVGMTFSTLEEFLSRHHRYLREYKIKVQGLGVLYAVNAIRCLHSIPKNREKMGGLESKQTALPANAEV